MTRRVLERMPPAAAPIAVTIVGGVVLLAVLGMLLGRAPQSTTTPAPVASQETAEEPAAPEVAEEPARETEEAVVAVEPAEAEVAAETASDLPVTVEEEARPDPSRTASILPAMPGAGTLVPSVPVAETEAEIATLEEAQRRAVEADVGAPALEETASLQPETTAMRRATATRYVNMRAGPQDEAEVLVVVPALAEIEAETDCNWCKVTYEDRTGYIYKSFINYVD